MPGLDLMIPFLVTMTAFAVMPGPALLYTAAQTMAHGRKGGFMAALGIHTGAYVHIVAAAAGLSAVFVHVPLAYAALKVAGALYLVWLGIEILRRPRESGAALPSVRRAGPRVAFVRSMLVEILNPKAALFFVAFLPQFVDAGAALPLWAQFLVLGTITNLAFSSADVVTVVLTDRVVARLRRSGPAERAVRWASGLTLVGLGAHLALAER